MSSGVIEIPLTHGKVALIDAEDYELVSRYKWQAYKGRRTYYSQATVKGVGGKKTTVKMARVILGLNDPSIHVDHINGDGLDNRRSNLRHATQIENARNRAVSVHNQSGFKGVCVHGRKWQAQIRFLGHKLNLGTFATPQEAARAYDAKARELFGEFARLNFP